MEYRRLSMKQKAVHWQRFHEQQSLKRAQQAVSRTSMTAHRSAPSRSRVNTFWSLDAMQTLVTPSLLPMPPAETAAPLPASNLAPSTAPLPAQASVPQLMQPPGQLPHVESKLTWMQPSDWQRQETLREAGIHKRQRKSVDPEQAQLHKEAEARRKRVRRVNFDKEDRDALRELANSRNDGSKLELPPTPAGLRETALDGTPRSAKAAGLKLRKLTRTFYERLKDPRFYGVTEKQLRHVEVKTKFCPTDSQDFEKEWTTGVRRLKQYGGSINFGTLHADEDGNLCGGWVSMSQFLSESDTDSN